MSADYYLIYGVRLDYGAREEKIIFEPVKVEGKQVFDENGNPVTRKKITYNWPLVFKGKKIIDSQDALFDFLREGERKKNPFWYNEFHQILGLPYYDGTITVKWLNENKEKIISILKEYFNIAITEDDLEIGIYLSF